MPGSDDVPSAGKGAPWVCVLGGSRSHLPFLRAAKRFGAKTLVFDRDPAAPAREAASRFAPVSTHDARGVLDFCAEFFRGTAPAGCFTYSSLEPALQTVAAVVERYRLRGPTPQAVETTTCKAAMRKELAAAGLRVPRSRQIRSLGELEGFIRESGRVVVKPSRGGTGSSGVAVIDATTPRSEELLGRACRLSSDHTALAEDYQPGPEFTMDGYVAGGTCRVLGTGRKRTLGPEGNFAIAGYTTGPSRDIPSRLESRLEVLAEDAVRALRIDDAFFSFDVVWNRDAPVILDAGLLLDAKIDRLLAHAGVDVYGIPYAIAFGTEQGPHPRTKGPPRAHGLRFLYSEHPGTLETARPGGHSLRTRAGRRIEFRFEIERPAGTRVDPPSSVADTLGWICMSGPNQEEVWRDLNEIELEGQLRISPL